MTTYNNVVDTIRDFCSNHAQVRKFYCGQAYEFQASDTNEFPCVIMVPQSSRLSDGQCLISFKLYVADLQREGADNLNEILSDTLLIMSDFASEFEDSMQDYGFALDDALLFECEPFEEELDFILAGWVCNNFDLQMRMSRDCSAIPEE